MYRSINYFLLSLSLFILHSEKKILERIWIGLTDRKVEGKFEWNINQFSMFINWCSHEPNNYANGEDCVELKPTIGCWNDIPCQLKAQFVCEIP